MKEMLLSWDETLAIDGGEIDRDHKYIIDISNRITQSNKFGLSRVETKRLLCDYVDYIAIHFHHEEALMAEIRYPDKGRHIDAHDKFFARLNDMIQRFEENETNVAIEIASFVGTYTFNHIDTFDRQLAKFCQDQRLALDEP